MNVEASKQFFVAFEQRFQHVDQKALAKAPWTGKKIEMTLVNQLPDERGLVDIVEVPLPNRPEVIDSDGKSATVHL